MNGKLKWQKCRYIPTGTFSAQAVVIRGIVYVGGGDTTSFNDDYLIQQYSPTNDTWYTLPPAPVRLFAMGDLNGQLVIVGGYTRQGVVTGKVHTVNSSIQKWVESIAPMHTARYRPAVYSQPSCLTVVGGRDQQRTLLSDVEIFVPHTSQWHKMTSPAPSPLYGMTTTVINNKCFIAEYDSTKVYQLCVSLHQTTSDSSNTPQVITEWTNLGDLPHKGCGLGSINGCLLAVGGGSVLHPITTTLGFSPIANTWKTVGELPEPRCNCTTVLLPTGELLVMGGRGGPGSFTNKVWRAARMR